MKKRKSIRKFLLINLTILSILLIGLTIHQLVPLSINAFSSLLFPQQEPTSEIEVNTKRIAIITGHGYDDTGWYDSGAIAYDGTYEATLNSELASDLKRALEAMDIDVEIYDENVYRNIMYYDKVYDFSDYDFVLELHFNASDSSEYTGTEIIYNSYNKSDLSIHNAIGKALESITGFSSIYEDDAFLTQRTIASQGTPSLLLETVYIDNKSDYSLYLDYQDEIVEAIANALNTLYS